MKWLLPLFLCFSANATNYFINTNGSSGNDGLSTSKPWPISYLPNTCGPDNTVYIMPGVYSANQGSHGNLLFYNTGLSAGHRFAVKALSPPTNGVWTVRLTGGTGGGLAASTAPGFATDYVDIDGIESCTNAGGDGISIGAFSTVTRCWVHHNAQNGINSSNGRCRDNIFGLNLLEYNGTDFSYPFHYHNIYVYGANNIFTNNVSRYDGAGHGAIFYSQQDTTTSTTNNIIANNLIYGNTNANYGLSVWSGTILNDGSGPVVSPGPNYVFNNTILDSILIEAGNPCISNNIINPCPGNSALEIGGLFPPVSISSDYNAGIATIHSDPHEVVTTWAGLAFVNTNRGLYWLQSGSTARGVAKTTIHLAYDFFGTAVSTWPDIGAFQYTSHYAADTRTLDPSPQTGAPYWASLSAGTPPSISVNPVDQTAHVGDNVTWTVTASGDPTLHYQWTWNGDADGTDSSSFLAPNVLITDNNAKVKVTVSNGSGSATSTTATLTVLPPAGPDPVITAQPQPATVYASQSATFTVAASGNSTLHYQWKFNGSNVGSDASSYTRTGCTTSDSGKNVKVTVSDTAGSVDSNNALLTVNPDPQITAQPQNTTVLPGQAANFSVTVVVQSQPTFQWKVNGSNTGTSTNVLALTNRQLVNNGDAITCVITDTAGTATTSTATLTVLPVLLGVQLGGGVKITGGVSFNK